ncbi:glycosyltransferase family 2 protein [Patescibacteria group bacterium]|nr:glycosyltransferase family 2 protein [Patescibacteria group bacterium]
MRKISVVINTLNEEKNLPIALASVKEFADEIVVCDMYSDDKTVAIAEKAGAKIFKHKQTGYVEPARNFAIGKATGDWILILDADEKINKILADKLRQICTDSKLADYFRIPRKNIVFGKWVKHSRWWPDYNIRFFKKSHVSWSEVIHSVPMTKGKGADLEANEENAIVHYHYTSVEQYINRMNRYTSVQSEKLKKDGYKFEWSDLIKKPANEFLSRYFQGEGYKDGVHGLALAGLQAFSEFVMYLKTWPHSAKPACRQGRATRGKQLGVKDVVGEMKSVESDFHYWQADVLLKEIGGIKNRIKRKLKI